MRNKRPRSQVAVRFQDCDPFGHLNNAQYIQYFVNAREDHLRAYYDFDIYQHSREHRANWVVTGHQIAYLRPALPGETITIETGLMEFGASEVHIEGIMMDETSRHLKAVQWTAFRYVNLRTGRPAQHPEALMDLLASIKQDTRAKGDLQERIHQIKQALNAEPMPTAS